MRGGKAVALLAFQARAALFGLTILAALFVTDWLWRDGWPIYRYDALFVLVVAVQGWLLASGRETWREAQVIFAFHIVGFAMEVFKTAQGSWVYPEESLLQIGGVPLFTGFMYSAVGSYIARTWRLGAMTLERAPPLWAGALFGLAIYVNFYALHYTMDIRLGLFVLAVLLYGRCVARFRAPFAIGVPLLGIFVFGAGALWIAENIGSLTGTWLYPDQHGAWRMVSPAKFGSWFLLMFVSFELVRAIRHESTLQAK